MTLPYLSASYFVCFTHTSNLRKFVHPKRPPRHKQKKRDGRSVHHITSSPPVSAGKLFKIFIVLHSPYVISLFLFVFFTYDSVSNNYYFTRRMLYIIYWEPVRFSIRNIYVYIPYDNRHFYSTLQIRLFIYMYINRPIRLYILRTINVYYKIFRRFKLMAFY